jgi:DNA-binding NarL/FixJ family response regulator
MPDGEAARLQHRQFGGHVRLTPRELAVLRLMADGLTTKEIAASLGITFKTVASHRWHILEKLDVHETVMAVQWAIRTGLIDA